MKHLLEQTLRHAVDFLDGLDDRPVGATATYEELREKLGGPLPAAGVAPERVIDELVAGTAGGHAGSTGGRFFAWVIGGALPAALAADWLCTAWDQNGAMYSCAPAAAVVEEIAGAWMQSLLGLPEDASFAFTTGCQLAHVTCLAAARFAVLKARDWDVNLDGLAGAPIVRVITSVERHGSVERAIRLLGFGSRAVTTVPVDAEGRIEVGAFARILGAPASPPSSPTIVILDAADLNIGAFDPFAELIPLAKAAGAWVHIDGAFGLFACASRAKRPLTAGIALADSWATDGHKWLNVPFDSGFACIRDRAAHRASMTISASYLTPETQGRDQVDWNLEWSRRARGFAVYAALRELGRDGVEQLVDRCCAHALALVEGIGGLPGAEVLWRPTLNQGLVRFLDPRPGAGAEGHDARTDRVIQAINATGEAFFSPTRWRGKWAMRVSVVNWRTSAADVTRTVAAAAKVLGGL